MSSEVIERLTGEREAPIEAQAEKVAETQVVSMATPEEALWLDAPEGAVRGRMQLKSGWGWFASWDNYVFEVSQQSFSWTPVDSGEKGSTTLREIATVDLKGKYLTIELTNADKLELFGTNVRALSRWKHHIVRLKNITAPQSPLLGARKAPQVCVTLSLSLTLLTRNRRIGRLHLQ